MRVRVSHRPPTLAAGIALALTLSAAAPSFAMMPPRVVAGVGQTWKWAFKLFGMSFEGTAEMIEFSPGHRLQFKTTGKLRSYWTYAVERLPNDQGSKVTVSVSHDIPDSILGKVADRVALGKLGESSTRQILENLARQFAPKPATADKSTS